jgi:hypothetical protein
MKDICLYYEGASGGFYALTLLSLATSYRWLPNNDWSKHWDISSMETWKASEQWPNNQETSESDIDHKLFFICNPRGRQLKRVQALNDVTSIWLYTDLKTQLTLSWYKRAWLNSAWPRYNSLDEMMDEYYTDEYMYEWNNHQVWNNQRLWEYCDQSCYLQDVIKTAGDSLLQPLGCASNKKCQDFTDYWVSLHNEECQKLLK